MKSILKDCVAWDCYNWSRAISYWNIENVEGKKALGLGERGGGLSLFFSNKGASVICSDYQWIGTALQEKAVALHERYGVNSNMQYEDIDATNIPYENEFDIIFFKSILGGIGRNHQDESIKKVFSEIYKALKPEGELYFVENLEGSILLRFFRKRFSSAYKKGWNYLKLNDIEKYKGEFKVISIGTFGYLACISPNETIRNILGRVDLILEKIFKHRYIVSCVLKKTDS